MKKAITNIEKAIQKGGINVKIHKHAYYLAVKSRILLPVKAGILS
jgi:hypothetical protein